MNTSDPVGLIDSGVGGLSVLKEMRKLLPNEDYLYLADTDNAPYGTKNAEQILRYTEENLKKLVRYGCKAVVLACNTATAVAVETLRERYADIPIIGLEPALRPAVRDHSNGNILVIATPVTLQMKRFKKLLDTFDGYSDRLFCVDTQEIVSFVESGMNDSADIACTLRSKFKRYEGVRFDACVLGCTHFPFAKKEIEAALGYRVAFYDGGLGAAKRLEYLLDKNGCRNASGCGSVTWLTNGFEKTARKILNKYR